MPLTINLLAVRSKRTLLHDVLSQPDITTPLVHYSNNFVVAHFFPGWFVIEINKLASRSQIHYEVKSSPIHGQKVYLFH